MNTMVLATDERISMEHSAQTDRVWQEMHERLLSYIRNRVNNVHDAEDILQDVFFRIHQNLKTVKDDQSITAWMYRVARNAITDYYRGRAAAVKAMTGLAQDARASTEDDIEDNPTPQTGAEFAQCIQPMLNGLPENYRQALELTELNGLTQKQAAEQLELTVSGMKARVQRGRRKLKDALEDCCSIELDRRGGLLDYQRREGADCDGCDCS